jgi:uncharacterized damage-inducible protein DinB
MTPESQDEPVPVPLGDVFDLHSVPARDAKAAVEAYLEAAREQGFRYVRIIHGRGIGVQREMVRKVLAKTAYVHSYGDAPAEAGGWGATVVELGEPRVQEMDSLIDQYDAALAEVEQLAAPLSPEWLTWRAAEGSWSVAECLNHLAKVGITYAEKIEAAIDYGQKQQMFASGPFRYGWFERLFLRLMEPPPRLRVKAPRVFRPEPRQGGTLEAYRAANRRLRELAGRAKGLDLEQIRVASPATERLKISLGIALALAVAHERRHIHQMRQILTAAGLVPSSRR